MVTRAALEIYTIMEFFLSHFSDKLPFCQNLSTYVYWRYQWIELLFLYSIVNIYTISRSNLLDSNSHFLLFPKWYGHLSDVNIRTSASGATRRMRNESARSRKILNFIELRQDEDAANDLLWNIVIVCRVCYHVLSIWEDCVWMSRCFYIWYILLITAEHPALENPST